MHAKEARATAESKVIADFRKQYDDLMHKIKHHSQNGFFELNFYGIIRSDVKAKLQEMGYKISSQQCGRNESETVISWK